MRNAPLQEIAETVSRALTCLKDRLIWPYCMPLMAEQFLELHEEIEGAHEAYIRYAKHNAANPILSGLHDRLALLLGNSLLGERDHAPRRMDRNYRFTNEVIPVQEWIAIDGMTQQSMVFVLECRSLRHVIRRMSSVHHHRPELSYVLDHHLAQNA